VHVEIDATTRRPTPIPDHLRALMATAVVEEDAVRDEEGDA
jgi:acyl-CoA thioester hydrolase